MDTIQKDFKKREVILKERDEHLFVDSFTAYSSTDSFYGVCENLFFNEGTRIEFVNGLDIQFVDGENFIHYQVDYTNRGSGIIKGSMNLYWNNINIFDDGFGNLIDSTDPSEQIVGNIFYNSGNVFLFDKQIVGNSKNILEFTEEEIEFKFKRETHFIQNKIYLEIDKNEYNNSSNPTFKESDAPYPFISCIYLYNEDNEFIAKAQLSKPISTEVDLFIVLDDLETV